MSIRINVRSFAIAAAAISFISASAGAVTWNSFVIRHGSGAPTINQPAVGQTEFILTAGGQKAGLGTNLESGSVVASLNSISIQRLDDSTRYTAGSGPAVAPYINLWVYDANGNHAVLANEPSDGIWSTFRTPGPNGSFTYNISWDQLKGQVAKVFESNDFQRPGTGPFTFNDFASYSIGAPTVAELTTGWSGLGTGAPRELGTNVAYDFNWVFGDTLSNYVSGDPGYVVGSPLVAVPEPTTLAILAGVSLIGLRRRGK